MSRATTRLRWTPWVLCAHLGALIPGPVGAQQNVAVLDPVVVSGARGERVRDALPMSVTVFDAQAMEQQQIGDIKDLVADLPNVSVKHAPVRFRVAGQPNSTGRDGNAGFTVRGLGGNRVLMLEDGVRLARAYTNGNSAFGRDTLMLGVLKQIEIVPGPASVLYGSDGVAGLVNFITHEPADFLAPIDGRARQLGGRAAVGWNGADDGLSALATVAGRASEQVQWMVMTGQRTDRGLRNMGRDDSASTLRTRPNPQTARNDVVLAKAVYLPTAAARHVLTLEQVRKSSSADLLSSVGAAVPLIAPTATALVSSESAEQWQRRARVSWDARYVLDTPWADQFQTSLSWQNTDAHDSGRTVLNLLPTAPRLRQTRYDEHVWLASFKGVKTTEAGGPWSQTLTWGVDLSRATITSWFGGSDPGTRFVTFVPKKYFPDTRDTSQAIYLQSELSDGAWSVTPGLRHERFALDVVSQDGYAPPAPKPGTSMSGAKLSPKLGVLRRLHPEWTVYGNWATGFRAPNSTQINGFADISGTSAVYLSNPELKPETSKNIELGARARLGRLTLDAAVFRGEFNDLIVDKKLLSGTPPTCNPACVYQSVNVDNASIWGYELNGRMDWGHALNGRWSTPFAYGRAWGRDNGTQRPLNSIDPALLVLGLDHARGDWGVRATWRYHAAKPASEVDPTAGLSSGTQVANLPAATTLDLSARWQLRPGLRLQASIVNLTDRKHWLWSDVQGLTTAGAATTLDAYTQPGRHGVLSLVADF